MPQLRILSWNVNGIRAVLKKNFSEWLLQESPDMICLQETRAHPTDVQIDLAAYEKVWNPCEKQPGYYCFSAFVDKVRRSYGL